MEPRSGGVFIVYKGGDYSSDSLKSELNNFVTSVYTIKSTTSNGYNFIKVVRDEYKNDRDPFYVDDTLCVSGFVQNEMQTAVNRFSSFNITDSDKYHSLINYIYKRDGFEVFDKLSKYANFCSVILKNSDSLVAGRTKGTSEYNHLFYGYTNQSHELMYSNSKVLLTKFCDEIYELPENSYMVDNVLYDLKGKELNIKPSNQQLIKKTKENTDSLFDGLNALLSTIANQSIKEKIEDDVNQYLSSGGPKKRLEDYISSELDKETLKQVLLIIKKTLDENKIEDSINNELKNTFDKKLEDYIKTIQVPVIHIIKLKDTVLGRTNGNFYHEKFEQILSQVQLDEPIMLIGPAGSGKNVAVSQVADALGKHMFYTNNASNEFKLTGFIDAGGNYRDTEFYKAFKTGGLFFLDEIDNSDPSALIVINSALANGYMAFPHETIDRHPEFRIVAAANTWGKGSDLQYVGRNALDAATLDRFDNIFFDYDRKLEEALYPDQELLKFMWAFRDAVYKSKIPHVISTRGIGKVYKKYINNIPINDILTSNVIKNLSQDDLNTIIGNMQNINSNNKFYSSVKSLRLGR